LKSRREERKIPMMRLLAGSTRVVAAMLLGTTLAACNLFTGSDDVSFDDDDGNPSGDEGGADAGSGGATSTATSTGGGATTSATTSAGTGGSSSSGGEACGGAGPDTTPLDAEEEAFLEIINAYRQQNGLGTLTHCRSLDRAAQGHSEDMRDQDYFDHVGLDGSAPWDRACSACYDLGCGPTTAMAENIAAGAADAQTTFELWKGSPGHNANMLNGGLTQIGIGRALGGGSYGVYWTNVFGGASEPSCL
jgi:uncharacterized protein YkwD